MSTKLFFIHGFSSNKSSNQSLINYCSQNNIKFHSINLPGHGDEDFGDNELSVEAFGEIIKDYLIQNNLNDNLIIYGHSMGGAIASYLTSKYRDELGINKLILEDPLNGAVKKNFSSHAISEICETIIQNKFNNKQEKEISKKDMIIDWIKKINDKIPKDKIRKFIKLFKNITSEEALNNIDNYISEIKTNSYVIFGENDFIVPVEESIQNFNKLNDVFTINKIANAKHSPNRENPEEYNKWLTEVMKK